MDTSDAVRVSYDEGKSFEILVEPELAKEAKQYANHAGRKTVKKEDVRAAK